MITKLPPELRFYTIDFLRNDKSALSACSLSCSALAAVCKPLLFHTLRTHPHSEETDRFERLLESDPSILPLVKRIEMKISASEPGEDLTIRAISRIMTHSDQAQYTAPVLKVTLRGRFPPPPPNRLTKSILPRLSPVADWVTSLDLDKLYFGEETYLWNIVLAFRVLKSLVLGRVKVWYEGVRAPFHPESKISHLSLKESSLGPGSPIYRFLVDHPITLPSLTSLDMRFPVEFNQPSLPLPSTRFGEHYGPRVRTLRFGVLIPHYESIRRLDEVLDSMF